MGKNGSGFPPGWAIWPRRRIFFFKAEAREGDRLRIAVSLTAEIAGLNLLETLIYRENGPGEAELLAGGKLKVFLPE
jgi:hypothetical protein